MHIEQDQQRAADWPLQENAKEVTSLKELISASELDVLIEEALTDNPNLQQTLLALKITRVQRRQTTGERLPEVVFDAYAEKEDERTTQLDLFSPPRKD